MPKLRICRIRGGIFPLGIENIVELGPQYMQFTVQSKIVPPLPTAVRGHVLSFIDPLAVPGLNEAKLSQLAAANVCQSSQNGVCLLYPKQDYLRVIEVYDPAVDQSDWENSIYSVSCTVLKSLSEIQQQSLFVGTAGGSLKENLLSYILKILS